MAERRVPTETAGPGNMPTESSTITFEWPLTGIKSIFEEPNEAIKNKAVQSVHFGNGSWTILFYTHRPGVERNKLSLYINAMPQEDEWIHPLIMPSGGSKSADSRVRHTPSNSQGRAEASTPPQPKITWIRKGSVHFTISLLAPVTGKLQQLASKEASDHTFSSQSPNWGWSKFCSHDVVLSCPSVMELDKLIVSVSITTQPTDARSAPPPTAVVPRQLVTALGSMLDNPLYSDIVFHFPAQASRNGPLVQRQDQESIYAIKQLLTTRSEYFSNLLSGDFLEAGEDVADTGMEEEAPTGNANRAWAADPRHQDAPTHANKKLVDIFIDDDGDDDLVSQDEQGEGDCAPQEVRGTRIPAPAAVRPSSPVRPSAGDFSAYRAEVDAFPDSDAEYDFDETWTDPELSPGTAASNGFSPSTSAPIPDHLGDEYDSSTHRIDSQLSAALYGRSTPDSDAHQRSDEQSTTHISAPFPSAPQAGQQAKNQRTSQPYRGGNMPGRKVITIPGVAPRTYRALLHFLYTDQVEFAPLTSSYITNWTEETLYAPLTEAVTKASPDLRFASKSVRARINGLRMLFAAHKERRRQIDRYMEQNPGKPEPCSAKSLFRLADQLDLPDLRERAMEHIINNLTVDNVPWELFSHFTSSFPAQDLKRAEMGFFLSVWSSVKSSEVMKTIFSSHLFHPGLGHTFPLLLEQLEYRGSEPDPDSPPAIDP